MDIMLTAGGETYEALASHAVTLDLDGLPVRTLGLQGLLKAKQSAGEKDAADRAVLERAIRLMRG